MQIRMLNIIPPRAVPEAANSRLQLCVAHVLASAVAFASAAPVAADVCVVVFWCGDSEAPAPHRTAFAADGC
jgi:hypothetical protein